MAEFAAHLNQGTTNANPTIFEIVAEESMASVFRPAVSYALKVLASSNPGRWGWIWRFGDELHLCLEYIVQNYYLKNFGGSISEHFYGLKRVNRFTTEKGEGDLSSYQKYLSLIMLVGVPYAKLKLDQLFERVKEEYVSGYLSSNSSRKHSHFLQLKRTFIYVYPFLHFSWEAVFLCYHLLYIFRFSGVHSPLLHAIGVSLQRLTRQDILAHNVQNSLPNILSGKTVAERILAIPSSATQLLASVLANGLPVVVFFLKFIDWWYSSENKGAVQSVIQLPVPSPPPQPKGIMAVVFIALDWIFVLMNDSLQPAEHGTQLPPHPAQCPLCKKVRTNPAVLSSSGYVFCYPCVYRYLNQHGCCPVTHLPSASKQLVRLYVDYQN